jgi:hypothetical protein
MWRRLAFKEGLIGLAGIFTPCNDIKAFQSNEVQKSPFGGFRGPIPLFEGNSLFLTVPNKFSWNIILPEITSRCGNMAGTCSG